MADPIRGILLDIEGTTSSISFVYDVMFPFARKQFASYIHENWESTGVQEAVAMLRQDSAQHNSIAGLLSGFDDGPDDRQAVVDSLLRLMDDDVKATGLKTMQGLVWKSGFQSGEMIAHVYDDVKGALESWKKAGLDIRIYSSGSIEAQKLFFEHSQAGNLLPLFSGHYDTTTGPKKESASYRAIAECFGLPAYQILFVSDIEAELDAAKEAGMEVVLSIRPGNKPLQNPDNYRSVTSFAEIEFGPNP